MLNELKKEVGRIITYYKVKGCKVYTKTARVDFFNGVAFLWNRDKLGRENGTHVRLDIHNDSHKGYFYVPYGDFYIFLSQELAYKHLIEKLRKQRQEINKKMLDVIKEASMKNIVAYER